MILNELFSIRSKTSFVFKATPQETFNMLTVTVGHASVQFYFYWIFNYFCISYIQCCIYSILYKMCILKSTCYQAIYKLIYVKRCVHYLWVSMFKCFLFVSVLTSLLFVKKLCSFLWKRWAVLFLRMCPCVYKNLQELS